MAFGTRRCSRSSASRTAARSPASSRRASGSGTTTTRRATTRRATCAHFNVVNPFDPVAYLASRGCAAVRRSMAARAVAGHAAVAAAAVAGRAAAARALRVGDGATLLEALRRSRPPSAAGLPTSICPQRSVLSTRSTPACARLLLDVGRPRLLRSRSDARARRIFAEATVRPPPNRRATAWRRSTRRCDTD